MKPAQSKPLAMTAAEYNAMVKQGSKKPAKYRNAKVTHGTEVFDSRKEFLRWLELKQMEAAGAITELRRQVSYELVPKQKGERACHYVADFVYRDAAGSEVIMDVKSAITRKLPTYVMKRKLMLERYGIAIREV